MWSPFFFSKPIAGILLTLCFSVVSAQDAKYFLAKGDEFFGKGKFDDAIVNYSKAINLDPKYGIAYANRGYAYVQKQKTELAILDCTKAIRLEPGSPDFYFYRGQAYNQKNMIDSAFGDYTKAISLGPDTADYYVIRGDLYQQKGLYDLAIQDYTRLISLDSKNADNYRKRCKAYYYSNQIDLAMQDITKVFSFDSENFVNNNYRGLFNNSLGNYENSVLDFLTCLVKMPDYGNYYINIMAPLVRMKRFKEAALFYKLYTEKKIYKDRNSRFGDTKFESFLTLDKYKFYTYYAKAVTKVSEEKYDEALKNLDTASKVYGSETKDETKRLYSDVLSLNGYVLEKLDRQEEARANYEQSLVIDPRQPDLEEALVNLKTSQSLTRNMDKTPPEIKLYYANLPTRSFEIVADKTATVPVMGKAMDKSGIDSVKINGMPAKVETDGTFFANLVLKAEETVLKITATDKQKNATTTEFDLKKLSGEMAQVSFGATSAAPVTIGKYYAILIAEKDYSDPTIKDLQTPIRDVTQLRNVLINQYTFDAKNVDTLYNRSREDILETIIAKCKALTNKDNLLIYYAGHGDTTKDKFGNVEGYLVPSSAKKGKTSYYITSEEIKKALVASNAKHVLLLLDACYSGTFTRSGSTEVTGDIAKLYQLDSRKVMSSGNVEEVPDNSQFIFYILKFLKENTDKLLSTKKMWEYVSAKVNATLAQYAAFPGVGDTGGQFIFEMRPKKN